MTGSKSASKRYEILGTSEGAAADGTDIANSDRPSAGCNKTSPAAIVVTPPGRFSTITRHPSPSDSSLAKIRLIISGGVLAEFGATKRMVPEGKAVCALAGNAAAANTMAGTTHLEKVTNNGRVI